MNLYERYIKKETRALVHVLEAPENYQAAVIEIVKEILQQRDEPYDKLTAMAGYFQRKQIIDMLQYLDPLNDELKLPVSHFLSKSEMKEMLIEEFEIFMKDKDGFRFDVWKYAIGGF